MLLFIVAGCGSVTDSSGLDTKTTSTMQALGRQDCLDTCERVFNEDCDVCMMTPGNWPCYMLANQDYQFCIGTCPPPCDPYLEQCQAFCYTLPNSDDVSACLAYCQADYCG
jgi:hypothetical protein